MNEIQSPDCPRCGHPPRLPTVFPYFCVNDACEVMTWDPTQTLAELRGKEPQEVDLDFLVPNKSDRGDLLEQLRHQIGHVTELELKRAGLDDLSDPAEIQVVLDRVSRTINVFIAELNLESLRPFKLMVGDKPGDVLIGLEDE